VKCPNCQFELKNPGPNCPFCQFVLPDSESQDPRAHAPQTSRKAEAASAIPSPGGASPSSEEVSIGAETNPAQPAFQPPVVTPPPQGGTLKTVAILGGAFLLFKIGAFDNILMLFGLGAAPVEPPAAPSLTLPEPAPLTAAEEAREAAAALPQAPSGPMKEQTFDPLDDPRMKALNAEVDRKLEASKPKGSSSKNAEETGNDPEAGDWLFQGRLYDMISLKPVVGAELMLMDSTEQKIFTAQSDAKGRYEFEVPAVKGGFRLLVDHPYYLADYFDEKSPPYDKSPLSARQQLRAARPTHKPWIGGAKAVRRDLILYPEIPDR